MKSALKDRAPQDRYAGLHRYNVAVSVKLDSKCTAEDAEIDPADVRTHNFEIAATSKFLAEEAALDEFHSSVPIGVLDFVQIRARATRA